MQLHLVGRYECGQLLARPLLVPRCVARAWRCEPHSRLRRAGRIAYQTGSRSIGCWPCALWCGAACGGKHSASAIIFSCGLRIRDGLCRCASTMPADRAVRMRAAANAACDGSHPSPSLPSCSHILRQRPWRTSCHTFLRSRRAATAAALVRAAMKTPPSGDSAVVASEVRASRETRDPRSERGLLSSLGAVRRAA